MRLLRKVVPLLILALFGCVMSIDGPAFVGTGEVAEYTVQWVYQAPPVELPSPQWPVTTDNAQLYLIVGMPADWTPVAATYDLTVDGVNFTGAGAFVDAPVLDCVTALSAPRVVYISTRQFPVLQAGDSGTFVFSLRSGAPGVASVIVEDAIDGTPDICGNSTSFDTTVLPPGFAINDVALEEGDSGTTPFEFVVSLIGDTTGTSSVDIATSDATATAGSDYAALPLTTLTFAPGEASKTVTIDVVGDLVSEGTERFNIRLSNPVNKEIARAAGIGTILDDDVPPLLTASKFLEAPAGFGNGMPIVYKITIENHGGQQIDNPGDEFIDVLPPGVTLTGATLEYGVGTVTADLGTNTVRWNGAINGTEFAFVVIDAVIGADTVGEVVNQGMTSYDTNKDGVNDATSLSDDPVTTEANDPTRFIVGAAADIPALGTFAFIALLFALALTSTRFLR